MPEHPRPARPQPPGRRRGFVARARCPPVPSCRDRVGSLQRREPQQPGQTFLCREGPDPRRLQPRGFAEQRRAPRLHDDFQLSQHSGGAGVSFWEGLSRADSQALQPRAAGINGNQKRGQPPNPTAPRPQRFLVGAEAGDVCVAAWESLLEGLFV